MIRFAPLTAAALALALLSAPARAQSDATVAAEAGTALVELYTAQGCNPCRPANVSVAELADQPNVIVLVFPVDHWDYLGWRDTFARPEFSARQRAYAAALGERGLKTPQVVVNGARAESGAASVRVREVIARTPNARNAPLRVRDLGEGRVEVEVGRGPIRSRAADVWLASYDPRPMAVTPERGENAGRAVLHRNVVRDLRRIGAWNGGEAWRVRAQCAPACVAILQEPNGGAVIAAAAITPD